MSADHLLTRLDGVRATGRGRWLARCPAHEDRSPSLSIRELDDGRILVHDFAGCTVADVLAAVGLDLADLFPDRIEGHGGRREREPFPARDVLSALADEALIVACGAIRIGAGINLPDDERERVFAAALRFVRALDVMRPHPAQGRRACLSRAEAEELEHA